MPKPAPATSATPDTQAPQMPGSTQIQQVRNFLDTLGRTLTEANIAHDADLLGNCSCNGLLQVHGLGIILNDEGEMCLITAFGVIQNVVTLSDSADWPTVFEELEQHLALFSQVSALDDETLEEFSDYGESLVGFWILSQEGTIIHTKPRLLAEKEGNNALELEDEWSKMVSE